MNSKKSIESYGRFKNLPWFDKMSQSTIFIGGAGGIGSWLTLALARTGANIVILDMDQVEEHNIAGQVYGKKHVGMSKVEAISNVIEYLCGENNVTPMEAEVTTDGGQWQSIIGRCDAVCVGFDNLEARELIYKEWKANGKEDSLFVDGRLSAEAGTVYVVSKKSTEEEFIGYEETYFSKEERIELPCTMKATSHCGSLIAAFMTTQITNWFNNLNQDSMPRQVSNVEFHLPLMIIDQPVLKVKEYANTD